MSVREELRDPPSSALRAGVATGGRVAAILVAALLLKVGLVVLFAHSLYGDVIIAVNFGRQYLVDPSRYFITSKTFIGPVSWYELYHRLGVPGLKLFNLVLFVLAFELQRRVGRTVFAAETIVIALVLFAFYPGTNLTVVAGEQDDLVTLLFFGCGVLLYLRRDLLVLPGLMMGLAFLFKFTALIFFAGFAVHVLLRRGPTACGRAALGMLLPFVLINLVDGFDSTRNLLNAVGVQVGYSTWPAVGFKLLSTGLLVSVSLAWWAYWEDGGEATLLFCLLPSSYLAYVLLSRDAFSAGFVMMQGIFFAAFPVAQFLRSTAYGESVVSRRFAIRAVLISYVVIATAITYRNLVHDPFDVRDPAAPVILAE